MRKNLVLYVHGKGGSASESEHYKLLFPDYEVLGLDYKSNNPWDAGKEIHEYFTLLKPKYKKITLIANSIGAFFSMNANIDDMLQKAYFISPIVDMEKVITNMMTFLNISESDLQSQKIIHTSFGENLSWDYLCYVRKFPIKWHVHTEILYGSEDNITDFDTINNFANLHNANLTVMKNSEHYFHTQEQMSFLDNWIINSEVKYHEKFS